jgi:hypothetical protein
VDRYPYAKQRKALLAFAKALNSAPKALRSDECGDPRITGAQGHVYAVRGTIDRPRHPGYSLHVMTETARQWGAASRALSFAQVMQDGDTEGSMFLDRLPTPSEATTIRRYLGVNKRRELSPETVEKLRARLAGKARFAHGSRTPKDPASPGSSLPPDLPQRGGFPAPGSTKTSTELHP